MTQNKTNDRLFKCFIPETGIQNDSPIAIYAKTIENFVCILPLIPGNAEYVVFLLKIKALFIFFCLKYICSALYRYYYNLAFGLRELLNFNEVVSKCWLVTAMNVL